MSRQPAAAIRSRCCSVRVAGPTSWPSPRRARNSGYCARAIWTSHRPSGPRQTFGPPVHRPGHALIHRSSALRNSPCRPSRQQTHKELLRTRDLIITCTPDVDPGRSAPSGSPSWPTASRAGLRAASLAFGSIGTLEFLGGGRSRAKVNASGPFTTVSLWPTTGRSIRLGPSGPTQGDRPSDRRSTVQATARRGKTQFGRAKWQV